MAASISNGSSPSYLSAFRYDPYGQTLDVYSGANPVPVPFRYQGRILQSAEGSTDLYDFGARSYDPGLGTFTSFDSVSGSAQNPLTLNRYLYALGNPATLIDPDGHWACGYDANSHKVTECPDSGGGDWSGAGPMAPQPESLAVSGPGDVAAAATAIGSLVGANRVQGKAWEAELLKALQQEFPPSLYDYTTQKALIDEETGKAIRINGKYRIMDIIITNKQTGRIAAVVEAKSGHGDVLKLSPRGGQQLIDQSAITKIADPEARYWVAYKNVESNAMKLYGEEAVASRLGPRGNGTAAEEAAMAATNTKGTAGGAAARVTGVLSRASTGLMIVGSILMGLELAQELQKTQEQADAQRNQLRAQLTEIEAYDPDYARQLKDAFNLWPYA